MLVGTPAGVSAKEGQGGIGLFSDFIYVRVPAKVLVDSETKILGRVDSVQDLAVYGIIGAKWGFPVRNPQHFTLIRVELH